MCFKLSLVSYITIVAIGKAVHQIQKRIPNSKFILFSSHFGNLVFGCLANRKHHTENHTIKVAKKPKTKLPKYVRSQVLVFMILFLTYFTQSDFFNNKATNKQTTHNNLINESNRKIKFGIRFWIW